MKTFIEWINEYYNSAAHDPNITDQERKRLEKLFDTDVVLAVGNNLQNCRTDPYGYLGELSGFYKLAQKQAEVDPKFKELLDPLYELTQLATGFLSDIRNHFLTYNRQGKPAPDIDNPGYQYIYEQFMKQAAMIMGKIQHLRTS